MAKTKGGASTFYKDKIILLRNEGKTYKEITEILGCTKSLISYHLNEKTKQDTARRQREQRPKYKEAKRNFIWEYLSNHSCVMCGIDDPRVLEFDHIDPSNKRAEVSRLLRTNYGLDTIKEEIKKCRVLCANCHRIHTAEQANTYKHTKSSEDYWHDEKAV